MLNRFPSKFVILSGLLSLAVGCTSFRTTALYRFDNDSVAPECTNQKLKGLPVKLKVPSHLAVTIYEQQVLLAEDPEISKANKARATSAAIAAKDAAGQVASNTQLITDIKEKRNALKIQFDEALMTIANSSDPAAVARAKKVEKDYPDKDKALEDQLDVAVLAIPELDAALAKAEATARVAGENAATPKYALVSFSPKQLMVDTNLEYTDKIFLVDFKRPAGGILDLTAASMDDEQYFSQVQANVTERTIADVNSALTTLKDPLVALGTSAKNSATPTSAITPDGEVVDGVDFQKSVIAFQRFDISEPGWEDRVMEFVNSRLGCGVSTIIADKQDDAAGGVFAQQPYPVHVPPAP